MAKVQSNSSAATLEKMYNYTVSLISSMEILPTESAFPSYCELKNSPDKFYELYAEATHKYNVICDALQKLQHANAMLVKVLNDKRVAVNSIAPGFIETRWQDGRSNESYERINKKIAAHRFGTPEEVASLCYEILNNDYLSGSCYDVHGGYDYF